MALNAFETHHCSEWDTGMGQWFSSGVAIVSTMIQTLIMAGQIMSMSSSSYRAKTSLTMRWSIDTDPLMVLHAKH